MCGHLLKLWWNSSHVVALWASNSPSTGNAWSHVALMEKAREASSLERPMDRASRSYEDSLVVCRTAFDVDGLIYGLARDEPGPLTDAEAIVADLLQEEVGVVGESECDSPGDMPVVADWEGRQSGERRANHAPGRGAHVGEVPVRRESGHQVGIVGKDGPPGRGLGR